MNARRQMPTSNNEDGTRGVPEKHILLFPHQTAVRIRHPPPRGILAYPASHPTFLAVDFEPDIVIPIWKGRQRVFRDSALPWIRPADDTAQEQHRTVGQTNIFPAYDDARGGRVRRRGDGDRRCCWRGGGRGGIATPLGASPLVTVVPQSHQRRLPPRPPLDASAAGRRSAIVLLGPLNRDDFACEVGVVVIVVGDGGGDDGGRRRSQSRSSRRHRRRRRCESKSKTGW